MKEQDKNLMNREPVQRNRTVKKKAGALFRRFRELSRGQQAVFLAALILIAAGAAGLIRYGASLHSSGQTARELREADRVSSRLPEDGETKDLLPPENGGLPATAAEAPAETAKETPPHSSAGGTEETPPVFSEGGTEETPAAEHTLSTETNTEIVPPGEGRPAPLLPETVYPGNPDRTVSSRFRALQEKNADIVGWLKMGGMLDEAVVQRDNVFYLDHDALGKQNINGALFLDAGVALNTRPYTCIIYGHNMRSGAEFGTLRNYEKRSFYRTDPFITFDTMYESGRYVIFSVGNLSVEEGGDHYVDFFAFLFRNAEERQRAIDTMKTASIYPDLIDVRPEDQLLLLVTCVTQDSERRVVAARRVRENETEAELARKIAGGL